MNTSSRKPEIEHSVSQVPSDGTTVRLDRRRLLVGSAGLAAGGILATTAARADVTESAQHAEAKSLSTDSGAGNLK